MDPLVGVLGGFALGMFVGLLMSYFIVAMAMDKLIEKFDDTKQKLKDAVASL